LAFNYFENLPTLMGEGTKSSLHLLRMLVMFSLSSPSSTPRPQCIGGSEDHLFFLYKKRGPPNEFVKVDVLLMLLGGQVTD
jgi:hypothetical protein